MMNKQHIKKELERSILLNPGPATTSVRVKMALLQSDICPREKEFGDLLISVLKKLKQVVSAGDKYGAVLIPGPGTAAIESSLLDLANEEKAILILDNGAYGARMKKICETYEIKHQVLSFPWDKPIELRVLESYLSEKRSSIHSLAFVHHETTSGLLNPLSEISALAKKYDLKVLVDAMSSYAGVSINFEKTPVDYLISSSNKCVQGMAGLGFVLYDRATERQEKKRKSFSLDLVTNAYSQNEKKEFLFTGPVQVLYALDEALNELFEEGIEERCQRYSALYEQMIKGMKAFGFQELVAPGHHSRILTSFILPKHHSFSFESYHDYLYTKGITVYPGKIPQIDSFRISNIGELSACDIELFLEHTKAYLEESRIDELY